MVQAEKIDLKEYLDTKFITVEHRYNDLQKSLDQIKTEIPKIAKSESEKAIAKTVFIKPYEKIIVGVTFFTLLLTALGGYGKMIAIMDRFERLENLIDKKQVFENSDWMNQNKNTFKAELSKMNERLNKHEFKINLIEAQTEKNKATIYR